MSEFYPMEFTPCGAKNRSGNPCPRPPVTGRNRCYHHGGATPRGIAAGSFKTGKFSRDLPTRLAARYAEAAADPQLLDMRHEIALLDARILELVGSIDADDIGTPAGDVPAPRDIDAERALWRDIRDAIQERARLVSGEARRLNDMQQTITAERAALLFGVVLDSIRRNVSDRAALVAISADMSRLAGNDTVELTPVVSR